jgi:tripartite-type tricarboxylate transporter receptor subunit TctC
MPFSFMSTARPRRAQRLAPAPVQGLGTIRRSLMRLAGAAAAAVLIGAAGAAAPAGAQAQPAFPSQPLRWIVAFPAGGAADTVTRLLAKETEKHLGQPIVVENRPGGNTFIAVQALLSAKPDGYTAMIVSNDTLTVNPYLFSAPYDVEQSFDYVGVFGEYLPAVLVARKDFPANNAKEAVEYFKANAKTMNFASHGAGSTSHLRMELLLARLGVKMNHVPYKGGAPALQDLSGGQVDVLVDSPVSSLPLIKAQRIKPLATMGKERLPDLPGVMTLGEAGAAAGDFVTFQGIIAPRGLPPAVLTTLTEAVRKSLASPELRETLQARGLRPAYQSPADFRATVMAGKAAMKKVIEDNNIKVAN